MKTVKILFELNVYSGFSKLHNKILVPYEHNLNILEQQKEMHIFLQTGQNSSFLLDMCEG